VLNALVITELRSLIASFLFRQTHNTLVQLSPHYRYSQIYDIQVYHLGGIISMIIVGFLYDKWLYNKPHCMLIVLNCGVLVLDIYLFATCQDVCVSENPQTCKNYSFSFFQGFCIGGANLLYLILIPMQLARHYSIVKSLEIGFTFCFAGTVLGVTLGISLVGNYVFSDYLAMTVRSILKLI
jgi:hypothetical protein